MPMNYANRDTEAALEQRVLAALRTVTVGPNGPDVVRAGHVYAVVATGGAVRVLLDQDKCPEDDQEVLAEVLGPIVEQVAGVQRVICKSKPRTLAIRERLPGIRHVLGVHSGKGGVGKSTVVVNLAIVLARRGLRVGLLDADVYGPSCPTLLGVRGRAQADESGTRIQPMLAHGIKLMSLGLLMPKEQALIWRGSLVDEGLPGLFTEVAWGELDVLFVDLPPGTSDVHLGAARQVRLAGVVTVSAPGQTSVEDVSRGMEMFADIAVPCLGLVENMAGVRCQCCGDVQPVFGERGVESLAQATGVPLLARIPFEPNVALRGDGGEPMVVAAPDSLTAQEIFKVGAALCERLRLLPGAEAVA